MYLWSMYIHFFIAWIVAIYFIFTETWQRVACTCLCQNWFGNISLLLICSLCICFWLENNTTIHCSKWECGLEWVINTCIFKVTHWLLIYSPPHHPHTLYDRSLLYTLQVSMLLNDAGIRWKFHVRFVTLEPLKRFQRNLAQMLTKSSQHAEHMFRTSCFKVKFHFFSVTPELLEEYTGIYCSTLWCSFYM